MGDVEAFDLVYDPNEVSGRRVVECWIAHGPRALDPSFDPHAGDVVTVGDGEEPVRRGRVLRRVGDRLWVSLEPVDHPPSTDCVMCGGSYEHDVCARCGRPRVQDARYVDDLEVLALDVVNAAYEHFDELRDTADEGPELQRAIVRLANRLRQYHYEGDGCLDDPLDIDVYGGN